MRGGVGGASGGVSVLLRFSLALQQSQAVLPTPSSSDTASPRSLWAQFAPQLAAPAACLEVGAPHALAAAACACWVSPLRSSKTVAAVSCSVQLQKLAAAVSGGGSHTPPEAGLPCPGAPCSCACHPKCPSRPCPHHPASALRSRPLWPSGPQRLATHLDHKVADAAVEDGVVVVSCRHHEREGGERWGRGGRGVDSDRGGHRDTVVRTGAGQQWRRRRRRRQNARRGRLASGVPTAVCEGDEVLAGAGADVAVQLQVQVPKRRVQPHVAAAQGIWWGRGGDRDRE